MLIRNQDFSPDLLDLVDAAEHAGCKIAPLFPLTRTTAANPFHGLSGEPIATAAARLERSAGVHIVPNRAIQLKRVERGQITLEDIRLSRLEIAPTLDVSDQAILETTSTSDFTPRVIATIADLAAEHSGTDWPALISERIGTWAQSHFDTGEALWTQATGQGAWNSWCDWAMCDLTPEISGLTNFCETISQTQGDHWNAIEEACIALGIERDAAPSVFHRLLCDLNGWAGLGSYRLWEAEQAQTHDTTLSELLAIRLVWEQALHAHYAGELDLQWDTIIAQHKEPVQAQTAHLIDAILQRSAERASARRLDTLLAQAGEPTNLGDPPSCNAQLVFCMDVRSERLRRTLEIVEPRVQTYGTAGFFGLGVVNQPPNVSDRVQIKEDEPCPENTHISGRFKGAISSFSSAAVSSFAYVQAAGLFRLGALVDSSLFHERRVIGYGPVPKLTLDPASEAAADVAEAALRSIGLMENFAPVVVFVGHEARVTNDARSDLLQCVACGGHDRAMNARALSCLLNERPLRKLLALRGIEIPAKTVFRAGLHDTTGDTVTLFVTDPLGDHTPPLTLHLQEALDKACDAVRAERSTDLPATPRGGEMYARGGDWSQTRAEWGLAGCHWFVAAPRNATRNRNFEGKVFLHDYDFADDPDGKFLAAVVSGPLLIAAWINLQYYGATVAPQSFGSGSKLTQNVCGGLGVLDGASGRLRGGPSDQSLFLNGQPSHDPLRLVARIAAPQSAIDTAISTSPEVESLVEFGWLDVGSFNQT